ncbi:FKBP-type peptidyl-prolyl cis-trans isomerase [Opitutus sp. ER46]|uniref:FKBP-type peptidyl-prolyl cis-trans isomerase n=1 Tax=Opitutus sp. ER46 TaxID=2161864 RepID=UPI001304CE5C|nr:FKBP-type peptidyl-prolyl cis-trans isomerase [Opitutus sp. ER46]
MKRALLAVGLLLALFAGAYVWFARQEPPAPVTTPAPTVDAKAAEREALFGAEALAPEVQWRESGLGYRIVAEGTGPKPGIGSPVRLRYVGRLKDGTIFDRAETPSEFQIGATIRGLSNGLQLLAAGGKATFFIPPSQGYGHAKVMGIPPDSGLIFEVEVVEVGAR